VRALARDIDENQASSGIPYQLAERFVHRPLSPVLFTSLLQYLRLLHRLSVRPAHVAGPGFPVQSSALFVDYVVVNHHCFYARSRTNCEANSLVAVPDPTTESGYRVGELLDILVVRQPGLPGVYHLGHFRWLVQALDFPADSYWRNVWVDASFPRALYRPLLLGPRQGFRPICGKCTPIALIIR
jgi:hypothetical protein